MTEYKPLSPNRLAFERALREIWTRGDQCRAASNADIEAHARRLKLRGGPNWEMWDADTNERNTGYKR